MGLFGIKRKSKHQVNHGEGLYSEAGLPGEFKLSEAMAELWHPDVFSKKSPDYRPLALDRLKGHLYHGDIQPAIVMSLSESMALVTTYSDEFDSYFYLAFANDGFSKFKQIGLAHLHKPLLCSWNYMFDNPGDQKDIFHGPRSTYQYQSGWPVIVDLLCNDAIQKNKIMKKLGSNAFVELLKKSDAFYKDNKVRYWRVGTPLGVVGQYYDLEVLRNDYAKSRNEDN